MAVIVTGKEFKLLREVFKLLNTNFPPDPAFIPSKGWRNGSIVEFNAPVDPHFSVYKSHGGIWYICCDDIYVWREAYEFTEQFCDLIRQELKCKAASCHIAVQYVAQLKHEHAAKKVFFIGKCSWCDE